MNQFNKMKITYIYNMNPFAKYMLVNTRIMIHIIETNNFYCFYRYNLVIRVPLNLASYRASMTNEVVLKHFFDLYQSMLTKYSITDPDYLWNVDETAINVELRGQRIVTSIGKRHIYNMTYADRGQNSTFVGSCSASGRQGPSMVIFKGKKLDPKWSSGLPKNCELAVSPKGWISNDLFVYWFKMFIRFMEGKECMLLCDGHASHITPEIIRLADKNNIHILTFAAHTSHAVQPLDTSVYKSMKVSILV
jgi:DDE superfamily endonuclease